MSNLSIVIGMFIGILGFLFFFWKRLKEDYSANQIFSFAFIVCSFVIIGFALSFFVAPLVRSSALFNPKGLWFWLVLIFTLVGFMFADYKLKIRFYESLEATVLGFLAWLAIMSLTRIFVFIPVIMIALFYLINSRYKTFSWYKSGKVGFSGLSILAIFFLIRSIVALVDPGMVSFVGKIDAVLSIILSFVFSVILYKLSV